MSFLKSLTTKRHKVKIIKQGVLNLVAQLCLYVSSHLVCGDGKLLCAVHHVGGPLLGPA